MRCGKPLEEDEEFCGDCRDNSRSFEAGRALFVYDGIMQESMARFKYSSRREYGAVYAEELYRHYGSWVKQTGAGMLGAGCRFIRHVTAEGDIIRQRFLPDILASLADCW